METHTVLPRLMLVTDRHRTRGRGLVELVAEAVRGGVGIVQVRERDLPDDELRSLILRIQEAVAAGTPIVVNGSARVARTLRLGLHLPAAAAAVERAGPLWGKSAHDEAEAARAQSEGATYLVLGNICATASKPGQPGRGLALLRRVCRQVHPLPVYAIGGITVSRIPPVIHAGAHGVAVSGAILSDNDPARVAAAMALALTVALQAESPRPRE